VGIGARETTMAKTGVSFDMTQEWKSSLLRKPELVRTDVYVQGLEPDEVAMIREALGKGLTPNGFEVVEDTLVLRFVRNESQKPLQEE
jgi:hypothetical protein